MFKFHGQISASKSWYNRALILKSFAWESLDIDSPLESQSRAEDIVYLRKSLQDFLEGKTVLDAGLGGTTLRFLALRVSRQKGVYIIHAGEALLKRPQADLVDVLSQLGVQCEIFKEHIKIVSRGWVLDSEAVSGTFTTGEDEPLIGTSAEHLVDSSAESFVEPLVSPLKVSTAASTQFLSAVLLSSVGLPYDLQIAWPNEAIKSQGYLDLTLKLLKDVGIDWSLKDGVLTIPKDSHIKVKHLQPELDISSAFSLVAAGALNGDVQVQSWIKKSLQPDIIFTQFLKEMGFNFQETDELFAIKKQDHVWRSLNADLSGSPDLFPVLSVLCAFADGESYLYNASQLRVKESDRIAKTVELLNLIGVEVKEEPDGLRIFGKPSLLKSFLNTKKNDVPSINTNQLNSAHIHKASDINTGCEGYTDCMNSPDGLNKTEPIENKKSFLSFESSHDHRMAMAAGLLILVGAPIQLKDPRAVTKSYPDFFKHIGLESV